MFRRLVHTQDDYVVALIRIALGLVMFPHGAQKVLGWFGGYGFSGTLAAFTGQMGIPAPLALAVFAAEFLGSMGLIAGLFGRVAALGVLAVMLGAVVKVHLAVGFFMNWAGTQQGEGFEYHILAGAMALAIIIRGSGGLSLDRLLSRR
jgi:putative oxidoreductase